MILIAVFSAVIFVLLIAIIVILFRKKMLCCGLFNSGEKKSNADSSISGKDGISPQQKSNLAKVNNFVDQLSGSSSHHVSTPSESDCGGWGSGDITDNLGRTTLTRGVGRDQLCSNTPSDLVDPDIPPKPDVISTGYVPYGTSLRDYNPPIGLAPGQESPLYLGGPGLNQSRQSSVLNVSDPRFSATYGNPYLRQANPRLIVPYSSFMSTPTAGTATITTNNNNPVMVAPQSSSSLTSSTSTFQPPVAAPVAGSGNSLSINRNAHPSNGLIVSSVPTSSNPYATLVRRSHGRRIRNLQ